MRRSAARDARNTVTPPGFGRPVAQQQHELLMLALGLASKREITRIRIQSVARWRRRPGRRAATSEAARPTGTGSLSGGFRSAPERRL